MIRVFLRHDRDLFAGIGRLLFDILSRCFTQAAGKSIRAAMVSCRHGTLTRTPSCGKADSTRGARIVGPCWCRAWLRSRSRHTDSNIGLQSFNTGKREKSRSELQSRVTPW